MPNYYHSTWSPAPNANATPSNPLGVALDPRTDLPAYPRDGRSQHLEKALSSTAEDFQSATNTLAQRLDSVADEFAEVFEAEDKRRATLTRIQNTANPDIDRLHRERMQRLG